MQPDDFAPGSVWLVGAGPGDPDLLTMKAVRLIERADIVFHDALVGDGVLALIPRASERVSVGKRSGRHSKDQKTIDALLVEAAASGKRVVRLKGGDPSIFGRSAEELSALKKAGYAVDICPGITTACAAAASAGISLSLRGVARDVRFVTAHSKRGAALDIDWSSLAHGGSTLAFYMGRDAAGEIMRGLMQAGMSGGMPVMICCNVSGPDEQRLATRLDLLELATGSFATDAPTLILVGEAIEQVDAAQIAPANCARQMHG
ncbi:uroporphyrin-III methyltransferase [Sphingopyxis sp. H038]|uniref:uroporphyrinogen-III C-methyltransferase n=1 Tax=unclassified Sphingopyxis TaxID=2614943 RepID=UPI0007307DAC|nr:MULTISPECIES: uroporphyrinogen-III C-methyltransferase [unclassified Sphingopyxis]KTD99456.1 uroporphyrin-III methyltransferase [Sphingopyxis sp. H012]KTD99912.1 uroporphyrin-III methyltransferase [Sphingopyxis sp. H093]KTE09668.1 uroporphyrin-III methyltransferase [Sphingopyxis sp. H053]KTE18482.1 uroporphyrin-III methyltransferase [Sphingopyxis sp. H080]KTE30065.1 uroporphyrin-III methyltransferase [Sphingopyxis sp. H038]